MKNTQSKKLIAKRDGAIIIFILAAGAAALIFLLMRKNGNTAVISIDGQRIQTINFSGKDEPESFELEGAVIEIKKDRIRVRNSDCPNQICVHTGYISKKGEKIVCLPKKLVIEIE